MGFVNGLLPRPKSNMNVSQRWLFKQRNVIALVGYQPRRPRIEENSVGSGYGKLVHERPLKLPCSFLK